MRYSYFPGCSLKGLGRAYEESLLPVLKSAPAGEVRLTGGNLVGNYALKLDFSDGHNTGIYDFRLLRSFHGRTG